MDGGSRGAKIFRHQLGTLHQEDVLIYEEKNPDFTVSVENTLSGEFVKINIKSLFKPSTNEIWIKHAGKDVVSEKFWLL